jgi:F-type H+-transporting ATPase subunit b
MLAALAQLPASLALSGVHGTPVLAANGSFLVKPGVGLMVWTLVVFGATMILLARFAFPPISRALDRRQKAIEEAIDTAERARAEADRLLAEYRERLKQARLQADEILQRARQTAESQEHGARERAQQTLAEAAKRAEREIEAATARALDDLRKEVADLTVLATEKVTRKTLDESDQKRLVEEALAELDFTALASGAANN